ncbi:hypothetical protein B0H10DRAFT_1942713 [Mycena sp. CBHHK59/15]|nr:hypothetical protein B0H10DRAFT_1942713 [Mycena sp. CBHHK59/15]
MAYVMGSVPVVKLNDIDPLFLKQCVAIAVAGAVGQPDPASPTSPTPTLVSTTATGIEKPGFDADRRAVIVADYPDAFSDTYGTPSRSPVLYKTGGRWPQPKGGPDAQLFLRQMYPVNDHPIAESWTGIVRNVEAYLDKHQMPFTAVTGFGWGNQGAGEPFCPLLVTIGVEPGSVAFANAKITADAVKSTILGKAGFPKVEVAIWEWTTGFAVGPELPLNPLVDGVIAEFAAPFSSVLPLAIAPLKGPHYEGTASVFLRRNADSKRPLRGFEAAVTKTESRIGTLQKIKATAEKSITRLQDQEAAGTGDPERITNALGREEGNVKDATVNIEGLNHLHTHVVKTMRTPAKRVIGRVLHADPVGPSSGPEPFTIDWAVIELSEDAIDWDTFQGNKVYIGGSLDEESFQELMLPWAANGADYAYPEDGLLPIFGVVPESELHQPTQCNGRSAPAMPVIKNGLTTGTTVSWLNGLKALVCHYDYDHCDVNFTSFETTILPYGRRGAFSAAGDSGAIILDRRGRIIALLTGGGGGLTDETDVTFATEWCALEPHIKGTLEGIQLY